MTRFVDKYPSEKRSNESGRIRAKYSDRVPCIIERADVKSDAPSIQRCKFLVPSDTTAAALLYIVRKRFVGDFDSSQSLYMFIRPAAGRGTPVLAPTASTIGSMDDLYKNSDGFLYIEYATESTFG